jgi:putative permease
MDCHAPAGLAMTRAPLVMTINQGVFMVQLFQTWYQRHFTDPEAVILLLMLLGGATVVVTMGSILAPVLAAIVIAFVLEWLVKITTYFKMPRLAAVIGVFLIFCGLLAFFVFALVPLIWHQMVTLLEDAPRIISTWNGLLLTLPERYPEIFSAQQINDLLQNVRGQSMKTGQYVLSASMATIPVFMALVVYLIIVPLMVFFFMKDKNQIRTWIVSFLPTQRGLCVRVWREVHDHLGKYVLGKIAEIVVVAVVTWIVFAFMGLKYNLLLSTLVGFSVLLPYVGAAVVTLPIAAVGLYQFGFDTQFFYVLIAYGIIQAIDGNILAPLLFSGAVNIHPVAIIISILFFGGIWGFWGVFFSIPLAILLRAVINAWP